MAHLSDRKEEDHEGFYMERDAMQRMGTGWRLKGGSAAHSGWRGTGGRAVSTIGETIQKRSAVSSHRVPSIGLE